MADADFESDAHEALEDERFVVDVDGFEGPLDLLLELARRQKVDLQKISVLALAEQYLAFIEAARKVRLELAADYLVMAAWLAYLKSRLLLPRAKTEEEPEAGELAAALAERLRRLEVIRLAAQALDTRPRVGRDLMLRGMPDAAILDGDGAPVWTATIYDLMSAYARQRQKQAASRVSLRKRVVWSLAEAREALQRLVGAASDWTALDGFLIDYCVTPELARTVRASSFSAMLEMVKEGQLALRQDVAFRAFVGEAPPERGSAGGGRLMAEVARLFPDMAQPHGDAAARRLADGVRIAEALLFAATEPLPESAIAARLPDAVAVSEVMAVLRADYAHRGVRLVRVGAKWLFRTADDLAWLLSASGREVKKLSRAGLETLAIIAYHQPTTRAEIEDIRGVAVAKGTLDVLLETGWVKPRGRRRAPGRPITYGTTEGFLLHFGLETIGDLPGLDELRGAALFDGRLPPTFAMPLPREGLADDEDPLDAEEPPETDAELYAAEDGEPMDRDDGDEDTLERDPFV